MARGGGGGLGVTKGPIPCCDKNKIKFAMDI